jgi:hypothetical protein
MRGKCLLLRLGFVHPKNLAGFRLLCRAADCDLVDCDEALEEWMAVEPWRVVWIPYGAVDPGVFPNAQKVVLGPHNFTFPMPPWNTTQIHSDRGVYNCLSEWNRRLCATAGGALGLPLVCLPFPVDVERFRPVAPAVEPRWDCFLYVKHRWPEEAQIAEKILQDLGLRYVKVVYGSYKEEEYLEILRSSRFGVWVGAHESQGFALQEALSCNVPLVVWDVERIGQEIGNGGKENYTGLAGEFWATSCPYWSDRCGIHIRSVLEFKEAIQEIQKPRAAWEPRKFILESLSPVALAVKWGLIPGGSAPNSSLVGKHSPDN